MRKSLRHTGVLMMLAVLALGAVGAVYTLWYEDLSLHARVQTGNFDVDWSCETDPDGHTYPGAATEDIGAEGVTNVERCPQSTEPVVSLDEGGTFHPADELSNIPRVAEKLPECAVGLGDNAHADNAGQGDDNVLILHLADLYPYAGCAFWIDIHNDGTVPAHFALKDIRVDGDLSVLRALRFALTEDGCYREDGSRYDGDTFVDLLNAAATGEAVPETGRVLQLHEDEAIICHFVIYLAQANVENKTANIWIDIRSHQWNESPH